jgi:hypothetical protein
MKDETTLQAVEKLEENREFGSGSARKTAP